MDGMNTILQQPLLWVMTGILIGTIAFDRHIRRRGKRTERMWHEARRKRAQWLKQDPARSIESPAGQALLLAELGALELHLLTKGFVTKEEAKERERLSSLVNKTAARERHTLEYPYDL